MLNCQKCGFDNELGRIFCHSCGTKLDLSQIKGPMQGGPKLQARKKAGNFGRTLRMLLELAILLVIQVPEQPPAKPSAAETAAADRKRFEIDRLVTRGRAGEVVVTERDVNAFLGTIKMEKVPQGWLVFAPAQVSMEFFEGSVTAKMWGELRLGGSMMRTIYFSYSCVPEVSDGNLIQHITGGTIGTLPIHPKLLENVPVVQKFVGAVFGRLGRERAMLEKLTAITVAEEGATLEFQPEK